MTPPSIPALSPNSQDAFVLIAVILGLAGVFGVFEFALVEWRAWQIARREKSSRKGRRW